MRDGSWVAHQVHGRNANAWLAAQQPREHPAFRGINDHSTIVLLTQNGKQLPQSCHG
jgi:hypothetical protein